MDQRNIFIGLIFEPKKIKELRHRTQRPLANEDLWAFIAYRPFSIYLSLFLAKVIRVSPNIITATTVFISLFAPIVVFLGDLWFGVIAALILYNVMHLLDVVDGEVARINQQFSEFGLFFRQNPLVHF